MRSHLIGGLIVAAALGFGCDQSDSTSSTPPQNTTAGERAAEAATAAQKDATGVVEGAKKEAAGAVEETKAAGSEAVSAIQGEGQKLLDQAMQYIKENKFDLAEQTLVKLEGMKAQLPETMQKGIAQARSALDTAKKAAGK